MILLAECCNIMFLFKLELSDSQTFHYEFPIIVKLRLHTLLLFAPSCSRTKYFYETINGKASLNRIKLYWFYLVNNLTHEKLRFNKTVSYSVI